MAVYALSEAKAVLSRAIDEANQGEEVVITRHGRPVARLVPFADTRTGRLGAARGKIELLPGWDQPLTVEDLIGG